jgi:peptidoglycan/xylan/chitin deacetylase (PgdA/CDA1 family)
MGFARLGTLLTLTSVLLSLNLWAKDNAVILLYHHVSETTPAVTSVSPETFRQHMQYLTENHSVLPLQTVIEKLQKQQPLPDKTVVITFDDGYNNLYHNAHPIMQEFGFAYTIFINPSLIGQASYQLTWQQIQQMQNEGASFANHANEHNHLLTRAADESEQSWLARVTENIQGAEKTLQQRLGYSLKYFAYPYGEFDVLLKQQLQTLGYVGFAQHSGAIASHSDFYALPRYPAAGIYSNLDSLKVKLNSLAMPVKNTLPADPNFQLAQIPEHIAFEVMTEDINVRQVNCFQSGAALKPTYTGKKVVVAINNIEKAGRHRVNCTAPSIKNSGRFYWYSQPFFIPTNEGVWLE